LGLGLGPTPTPTPLNNLLFLKIKKYISFYINNFIFEF